MTRDTRSDGKYRQKWERRSGYDSTVQCFNQSLLQKQGYNLVTYTSAVATIYRTRVFVHRSLTDLRSRKLCKKCDCKSLFPLLVRMPFHQFDEHITFNSNFFLTILCRQKAGGKHHLLLIDWHLVYHIYIARV